MFELKNILLMKNISNGVVTVLIPVDKQRVEEHNRNEYNVKCTILAREADISSRKVLELFCILARNPRMNNRNESSQCGANRARPLAIISLRSHRTASSENDQKRPLSSM